MSESFGSGQKGIVFVKVYCLCQKVYCLCQKVYCLCQKVYCLLLKGLLFPVKRYSVLEV